MSKPQTVRLTSPTGSTVEVLATKEEGLRSRGFTSEASKAPAKKAASSKSSEDS